MENNKLWSVARMANPKKKKAIVYKADEEAHEDEVSMTDRCCDEVRGQVQVMLSEVTLLVEHETVSH